jgi:hypothetical protein
MKKSQSFCASLSVKKKINSTAAGKTAAHSSGAKNIHKSVPNLEQRGAPSISDAVSIKIVANVDVGFGNYLYIRGDGCGLSWERGIKMKPVDDTHWEWECKCKANKMCFEFKTLINDKIWSTGDNYIAIGSRSEVFPIF